jgi:hypothetical protein
VITTGAPASGGRCPTPTPASSSSLQSQIHCLQPPQAALIDGSSFHEPVHDGDRHRRGVRLNGYPDRVSGEREELRRLVDEIPDEQVPAVLADLRRRLESVPAPAEASWPPLWFGCIQAGPDFSCSIRT